MKQTPFRPRGLPNKEVAGICGVARLTDLGLILGGLFSGGNLLLQERITTTTGRAYR